MNIEEAIIMRDKANKIINEYYDQQRLEKLEKKKNLDILNKCFIYTDDFEFPTYLRTIEFEEDGDVKVAATYINMSGEIVVCFESYDPAYLIDNPEIKEISLNEHIHDQGAVKDILIEMESVLIDLLNLDKDQSIFNMDIIENIKE